MASQAARNRQWVVAILGAGLMGHGIAQVFAEGGHAVQVYDPSASALSNLQDRIRRNLAALGRAENAADAVRPCGDMRDALACADLVIEAAAENLPVKQALFAQVEDHVAPDVILASNTSVIPITQIASGLRHKARVLGTHWWNPPYLIPLVEVIGTQWTDHAHVASTMALLERLGKTPVHVRKDVPGFVGNRLQHALWREAIALVEQGVCDARTVDTVVKASFGRRLAVLGPLENADLVGTDLTLAIHETILPDLCREPRPSSFLRELVQTGRLGLKAGEGFRSWTAAEAQQLQTGLLDHLKHSRPGER